MLKLPGCNILPCRAVHWWIGLRVVFLLGLQIRGPR